MEGASDDIREIDDADQIAFLLGQQGEAALGRLIWRKIPRPKARLEPLKRVVIVASYWLPSRMSLAVFHEIAMQQFRLDAADGSYFFWKRIEP